MALSDEQRARIVEMFDAGHPRNDIARQMGVPGATVTATCRREGRTFDRAAQLLDLRADEADLSKLRERVTTKMLIVAEDALDNLDGPHLVYNFGGRDNGYNEHLLDDAPLEVRLDAMRAASLAVDKATRIVERSSPGLEQATGVLDDLASVFKMAADQYRSEEQPAGDDYRGVE